MFKNIVSWWRSLGGGSAPTTSSPICGKCGGAATVLEYRPAPGGAGEERHFCEPCAQRHLWIPNPTRQDSVEHRGGDAVEVPVTVERIVFSSSEEQVVVLREVGGPRRLSLITGYFEVVALWWALRGGPSTRPLTHQAWVNTATALGAKVESAGVLARRDDVYFAEIRLRRDQELVRVDVRPSDALLVSLRAGVPFLFAEEVLAKDAVSEPEPA